MQKKAEWEDKRYSCFTHRECECFPCHTGVAPEEFNCLFCYCPLYPLGEACGGQFEILENGVKDCSGCVFPHRRENYGKVIAEFYRIVDIFRTK